MIINGIVLVHHFIEVLVQTDTLEMESSLMILETDTRFKISLVYQWL